MFQDLQAPLAFGFIAALVTTIGLLAVAFYEGWSRKHAGLFALAASGMLLTLSLTHIAPAAFASTANAPMLLLAGFLGALILSLTVRAVFPASDGTTNPADAFTPVAAIACHSFIDGIVYTITFAADFESGLFTALSLILHEFPEGVIAFAILRAHNVSNRRSFFFAFLAAALTTPLGVVAAGPVLALLGPETVNALFAASAGLLLFVATGPLMAPIQKERPARALIALLSGVVIGLFLTVSPLHSHDHDHGHEGARPDFRADHAHDH